MKCVEIDINYLIFISSVIFCKHFVYNVYLYYFIFLVLSKSNRILIYIVFFFLTYNLLTDKADYIARIRNI